MITTINSCEKTPEEKITITNSAPKFKRDLKEIKSTGKLIVLSENSTASYFIYRGKKMGMEYEILKEYAEHLGVQLEIKMVNDLDEVEKMLNTGVGDLISCNLTITKQRKRSFAFTKPYMRSSQVLVQRKPKDWRKKKHKDWKKEVITDAIDLAKKKVYVWQKSSYYNRLISLQDEIGDTIYTQPTDGTIIQEDLIQQVADGFIDYTVTDENVAIISSKFIQNLDIDLKLSVKQQLAFGLRNNSNHLKAHFDEWLTKFMKTTTFKYIQHKYIGMNKFANKSQDTYSSLGGNRISKYDDVFKEVSAKYNWDWRMLASIVYQESKFKTSQESWVGAYGLMQFMPGTGPTYGVYPDSPPEIQIKGGMKKLAKDLKYWDNIPDSLQRIKFTLGTYNAGLGHIIDARKLAEKHGLNKDIWDDNVEKIILDLNKPKFYRDPLVKCGYMRGSETYNYVREIFIRYSEYESAFKL